MKTALISRYGAYGDVLFVTHIPRLVKEHFKIDHLSFETNYQGIQILQHNPFIDNLVSIDPLTFTWAQLRKRWECQEDKYDLFINFFNGIEKNCITMEDESSYFRTDKYRRDRYGHTCFYDAMTIRAELPEKYLGTTGEMYYPEDNHEKAKEWIRKTKEKYGVKYLMLLNLSGSSLHKKFVQAEIVGRKILAKFPDVVLILTGDSKCHKQEFSGDRILTKVQKWNFRTAALMVKYMDMYIGNNTGLTCVANMWNMPTLQLFTSDSMETHSKYAKNAYGIQSPLKCSPCYRGPYKYLGCPLKDNHPACVFFDTDLIVKKVGEIYGSLN